MALPITGEGASKESSQLSPLSEVEGSRSGPAKVKAVQVHMQFVICNVNGLAGSGDTGSICKQFPTVA